MSGEPPAACPIGVTINALVAERVRNLVDEFGDAAETGSGGSVRRGQLARLLLAVLRSLRLESVDGARFRLSRQGEVLSVVRRQAPHVDQTTRLEDSP